MRRREGGKYRATGWDQKRVILADEGRRHDVQRAPGTCARVRCDGFAPVAVASDVPGVWCVDASTRGPRTSFAGVLRVSGKGASHEMHWTLSYSGIVKDAAVLVT